MAALLGLAAVCRSLKERELRSLIRPLCKTLVTKVRRNFDGHVVFWSDHANCPLITRPLSIPTMSGCRRLVGKTSFLVTAGDKPSGLIGDVEIVTEAPVRSPNSRFTYELSARLLDDCEVSIFQQAPVTNIP